jgi:hypothetical protein
MKGKTYVPFTGTEPHLNWHWNGGVYTFGNRNDIDSSRGNKPWLNSESKVKPSQLIYNWRTSVPKEWYGLKSPDTFVHIKDSGKSATTLEFLGATQQYIHKICHPNELLIDQQPIKPPKILFGRPKSVAQALPRPNSSMMQASPVPKPSKTNYKQLVASSSAPLLSTRLFTSASKKSEEIKPRPEAPLETRRMIELSPELQVDSGENYKVTHYALPRALASSKKSRSLTSAPSRNKNIDQFLGRFEKPQTPIEPPKPKVGLDGWKLARIRTTSRKMRLPKTSFTPKLTSKGKGPWDFGGKHPEVYLDYLQFKKSWVEERSSRELGC